MDAWPRGSSQGEHVSSGEGLHVHRPVPSRPARITAKPRRPHHALPRHHHCFSLLVWLVAILSIYYFNTIVLKKSPRSSRESINSHINLKKRKICTIGFYEDLTVYIILKNLYHITKPYNKNLSILDKKFAFRIRVGLHYFSSIIGLAVLGIKKGNMLAPFLARIKKNKEGHVNQL